MVPHGESMLVTAPAAFRFTFPTHPERHQAVARILAEGAPLASDPREQLPAVLVELMQDIGARNGIGAMGYSKDDVAELVEGTVKQERLLMLAPRKPPREDLTAIFTDSLQNW